MYFIELLCKKKVITKKSQISYKSLIFLVNFEIYITGVHSVLYSVQWAVGSGHGKHNTTQYTWHIAKLYSAFFHNASSKLDVCRFSFLAPIPKTHILIRCTNSY